MFTGLYTIYWQVFNTLIWEKRPKMVWLVSQHGFRGFLGTSQSVGYWLLLVDQAMKAT